MKKFLPITSENFKLFCKHLKDKNVDAYILKDNEQKRNSNLKYLSGHPEDSYLVVFATGKKVLIPWDTIMAEKTASVDETVDYKIKGYSYYGAVNEILKENLGDKYTVEVETNLGYFEYQYWKKLLKPAKVLILKYSNNPSRNFLHKLRMIKSKYELNYLNKACKITNKIIDNIECFLIDNKKNKLKESDLAFFVEKLMKDYGGDGTSFETLTTSPKRSWSIHSSPKTGTDNLNIPGLSLIDFGVKYKNYCSDVTVSFAMKKTSKYQEKMISVVKEAKQAAIEKIKAGIPAHEVAEIAEEIIKDSNMVLPHGLGHGLGLDTHDPGALSSKPKDKKILKTWKPLILKEGMVLTVEPGVYDKEHGGCRLEDDIVVTKNGCKVLTKTRFMKIYGK